MKTLFPCSSFPLHREEENSSQLSTRICKSSISSFSPPVPTYSPPLIVENGEGTKQCWLTLFWVFIFLLLLATPQGKLASFFCGGWEGLSIFNAGLFIRPAKECGLLATELFIFIGNKGAMWPPFVWLLCPCFEVCKIRSVFIVFPPNHSSPMSLVVHSPEILCNYRISVNSYENTEVNFSLVFSNTRSWQRYQIILFPQKFFFAVIKNMSFFL